MKTKQGKEITLSDLKRIFQWRFIRVTNKGNPTLRDKSGVCEEFGRTEDRINVDFTNGSHFSLIPDILTDDALEGDLYIAEGRRKVAVAPDLEIAYFNDLQKECREILTLLQDRDPGVWIWRMGLRKRLQNLRTLISHMV